MKEKDKRRTTKRDFERADWRRRRTRIERRTRPRNNLIGTTRKEEEEGHQKKKNFFRSDWRRSRMAEEKESPISICQVRRDNNCRPCSMLINQSFLEKRAKVMSPRSLLEITLR